MNFQTSARDITILVIFVSILLFSGLTHSIIPHSHSHESGVPDLIHTVLFQQGTQVLTFSVGVILTAIAIVAGAIILLQILRVRSLVVRAQSSEQQALRRGIARYRRFD